MKVYQYLPDLKIVMEKPEGENPVFAKSEEDWKLRMKEWTNLKSYPASGFSKEHEGRDLVEGVHFEIDWKPTMGGGAIQAAVPLDNSPQPTEQPEVLYRWVRASERLPESINCYRPIRITDGSVESYGLGAIKSYYGGPKWYDLGTERGYTFDKVEWLEPLPSQPGESVDALGEERIVKIINSVLGLFEPWKKEKKLDPSEIKAIAGAIYAASHPSPSVDGLGVCDLVNSQEFDDLMYAYRTAPIEDQKKVLDAYFRVQHFVVKNFTALASKVDAEPSPQEAVVKEWREECERLAKVAEHWQAEYYKLKPPYRNPKLDNL